MMAQRREKNMSIQDTATKQYVSEAEVFADAFNYLIYDGEQVKIGRAHV